jgi:hypothetical protein
MNYMEIVKKSLSNAFKYRFLWLFGFFVASVDGMGWMNWDMEEFGRGKFGRDFSDWEYIGQWFDWGDFYIEPIIWVYLALAVFMIWFIFWVLSIFSEGALIHGISRKELNLPVGFSGCWEEGVNKFFRLLGLILLATLAVLFILFLTAIVIIPSYIASVWLGVLLTVMAAPLFIVFLFLVICVEGWAIRFAVLYNKTWSEAITNGWLLFKNNVGRTLGVAFSSFLTQLIFGILLTIGLIILAIPFVIIGMANLWLGLIPGLMLGLLILLIYNCIFGTFASSVWTIGFMKLAGHPGQTAVGETEAASPPEQPSDI